MLLFSSERLDGFTIAELAEQSRFFRLSAVHITFFHMAEATDLVGKRRKGRCNRFIGRRECTAQFHKQALIIGQQLALHFAFVCASEDIEHGPAEAAQSGKRAESVHHPRAEGRLCRQPGLRIAVTQQRRREVEFQLQIALERAGELLLEGPIGIKTPDLILIFDGHELEEVLEAVRNSTRRAIFSSSVSAN